MKESSRLLSVKVRFDQKVGVKFKLASTKTTALISHHPMLTLTANPSLNPSGIYCSESVKSWLKGVRQQRNHVTLSFYSAAMWSEPQKRFPPHQAQSSKTLRDLSWGKTILAFQQRRWYINSVIMFVLIESACSWVILPAGEKARAECVDMHCAKLAAKRTWLPQNRWCFTRAWSLTLNVQPVNNENFCHSLTLPCNPFHPQRQLPTLTARWKARGPIWPFLTCA